MRYQVRQRLLSLTSRYDIADEAGAPILEAVAKAISFHIDIAIRALDGREFVRVRQKLLSLRPRFDVTRDARPLATVVRRLTFRPRYSIDLAAGGTLDVHGSFWEHRYQFTQGDEVVAVVSRDMWAIRDAYGVEVLRPDLDAVVLAAVIAIDALRAAAKRQ